MFVISKISPGGFQDIQKQPPEGVLKNFAKFTRKLKCQSLLFDNISQACNFIKKETLTHMFSCEFCERTPFYNRIPPVGWCS